MRTKRHLLLQPKDFKPSHDKWKIAGALNPAAIRLPNKKIMLMVRVAEKFPAEKGKVVSCPIISSDVHYETKVEKIPANQVISVGEQTIHLKGGTCRLTTMSHFRKVILSKDGLNVEEITQKPAFTGTSYEGNYGVEDPRITKIGSKYYMTYVTVSTHEGVSTNLATSRRCVKWKRKGIIFREQNKDTVLLPGKCKNKYVALHRPEGFFEFSKPSIWIAYSPDTIYWGREKALLHPRPRAWDEIRIGSGPPPIKTKRGWLTIYHGVKQLKTGKVYSAGALLLDRKNPEKILARSPKNKPLFKPIKNWEKEGFVNQVVFPTGVIVDKNKKDLLIYYGGADSVVGVTKIGKDEIFDSMEYYD